MTRDTRVHAGEVLRAAVSGDAGPTFGPRIVVVDGVDAGAGVALRAGLTIGRAERAELRIEDPEVSRIHARVTATASGFAIEDLGSKNGLSVNGRRVRGAEPLRPGDFVEVGKARLRVDDFGARECPEAVGDAGRVAARAPTPGKAGGRLAAALLVFALLLLAAA